MADMPAPIFSPPPTTANPAAVPPRRDDRPLRSSCGQCNQAKVKCSKERPTCRRCATRNTPCVYSISLRGVKRPRPRPQADQACPPKEKKRTISIPSPIFSEPLPTTTFDFPPQPTCLPDLGSSDIYPDGFVDDDLAGFLSMNPFDAPLPDPTTFPFPLDFPDSQPAPPIQPVVAPQMALRPMTIPLSPISPPGSRDGHCQLATVPTGTPCLSSPVQAPVPATCWCQQTISFKLTELSMPKPPNSTLILDDFLTEHRANMALCTSVLHCADPHHTPGMLLLTQMIALLQYMTAAFDQILPRGDTSVQQQQQQQPPAPPPTPVSRSTSASTSPIGHRKEQITQANTLRAELAKLGVLIQEFDRRYCTLDNPGFGDATFLLSPLFANLLWKTQAKFDAVRSWMPWL
ncbi:putative Zn(II)2Cys6 transcription factor [Aspergillus mulundensis]|uniref:Putative Zn(II)2Cys6 transcription factor n=1 Tax=Aspergillus mulundensis TaxID=1810919 RepID=A0A3D8RYF7_9EURO|nr:putative Zn(II)2Cys6 transcription factor [Aspergillus mulundensis]RDW79097.1 putative Zn(II)2Cys6 transcription factor [Aspergillus mulundensis]